MGGGAGVRMLLVHSVLTQLVTFVLRPATSYRALELEVPASWLGVLSASFAVVPLMLALPAGHIVDRVGERRVLLAGGVLMCAASAGFLWWGGSLAGLVVGSVLLGTGHLCCVVGQQALVANTTKSAAMDTAFGHYTFMASLGQAAGPMVIAVVGGAATVPDTTPLFVCALVVSVVLLGSSLGIKDGPVKASTGGGGPATVRDLLRMPSLVRALLTSCLVLAAVDISLVYLPALGAERGIAAGVVGVLLTLRAAASMASRFFLGRLAALLGRGRLLTIGVTSAALGLGLSAAPVPVWLLAVAVTVAGLGLGVGQPLTMSWLAESTPPGLRGRAMSLRLTGNRAGQVVVPAVVGLVAAPLGAAGVLALTAGTLAWAAVSSRKLAVDPPEEE